MPVLAVSAEGTRDPELLKRSIQAGGSGSRPVAEDARECAPQRALLQRCVEIPERLARTAAPAASTGCCSIPWWARWLFLAIVLAMFQADLQPGAPRCSSCSPPSSMPFRRG